MGKVEKKVEGPTLMELKALRGDAFMNMEQAKAVEQQALNEINQLTQQINVLEAKDGE